MTEILFLVLRMQIEAIAKDQDLKEDSNIHQGWTDSFKMIFAVF